MSNLGNLRSYFALYPMACIGEPVKLTVKEASKSVSGHLCNWDPLNGDEWPCNRRGKWVINFNWRQFILGMKCLLATEETGRLHQEAMNANIWFKLPCSGP